MTWFRKTPLDAARWVVIDCETSGLDAARDRLLAVGAIAVREGQVRIAESFHSHVRQDRPSAADNILIHGIGGDAQLGGQPLEAVLRGLSGYAGDASLVAFHAAFDAAVLRREGFRPVGAWYDLAILAPALFPGRKARALDEWLAEFGIPPDARHHAIGDAFAAAQLLLVVLAEAKRQRLATVEDLRGIQRNRKWL